MAKPFSSSFKEAMKKFYRGNKDASLEQAKKRAAMLGYSEFSQAAHDRFRKGAGVKVQRAKAEKSPAGEHEAPRQVWMDFNCGEFNTDFASGKPGTEVAIYNRVAVGTINLDYPMGKNGSRRGHRGQRVAA